MDPLDIAQGTLKAMAGQMPVLGPVLSGLFEARQRQLQEERLAQFLEDLRDEAITALEEHYNEGYLQSQDYLHLVLLAFEHAQRTRRREKRRLYARALLNAARKEWEPRCDLAEELMNALADLSPTEIRVLQAGWDYFASPTPDDAPRSALEKAITARHIEPRLTDFGLGEVEIRAYLGKLQRLGFTEQIVGTIVGYKGGAFRMTPLFDRLMELIRVPAA